MERALVSLLHPFAQQDRCLFDELQPRVPLDRLADAPEQPSRRPWVRLFAIAIVANPPARIRRPRGDDGRPRFRQIDAISSDGARRPYRRYAAPLPHEEARHLIEDGQAVVRIDFCVQEHRRAALDTLATHDDFRPRGTWPKPLQMRQQLRVRHLEHVFARRAADEIIDALVAPPSRPIAEGPDPFRGRIVPVK